jgi:hypothetical protein
MSGLIVPVKIGASGIFDIFVKHDDGSISEYPNCKNKITNQGLDTWGGVFPTGYSTNSNAGITVGTGNTSPTSTDVVLQAPLAFTTNQTAGPTPSSVLTAPYAASNTVQYTFAVGAVIGNIAEVGMLINNTTAQAAGNRVFSRALIQVGGSPGTITLTSSDQLIVNYTLTFTYAADTTGSLNVTTDGTSVANGFTVRPANLTGSGSFQYVNPFVPFNIINIVGSIQSASCSDTVFVPTSGSPTPFSHATSTSSATYTTGSFTRNFTASWATNNATNEKMYWVEFGCMGFQILFTNAFGPTSTQTMDFGFTLSWAST